MVVLDLNLMLGVLICVYLLFGVGRFCYCVIKVRSRGLWFFFFD